MRIDRPFTDCTNPSCVKCILLMVLRFDTIEYYLALIRVGRNALKVIPCTAMAQIL